MCDFSWLLRLTYAHVFEWHACLCLLGERLSITHACTPLPAWPRHNRDILLLGSYPARRPKKGEEEEKLNDLSFSSLAASWSQAASAAIAMVEGNKAAVPPPIVEEEEKEGNGEAVALARAAALGQHLMGHREWAGVRGRLVLPEEGRGVGPVALLPLYPQGKEARHAVIAALAAGVELAGRRKRQPPSASAFPLEKAGVALWMALQRRLRSQQEGEGTSSSTHHLVRLVATTGCIGLRDLARVVGMPVEDAAAGVSALSELGLAACKEEEKEAAVFLPSIPLDWGAVQKTGANPSQDAERIDDSTPVCYYGLLGLPHDTDIHPGRLLLAGLLTSLISPLPPVPLLGFAVEEKERSLVPGGIGALVFVAPGVMEAPLGAAGE